MKIFHICSYYSSSAIYKKLFSEMSKHPVKQYIFFPTHKKRSCNDFDMLNNCKIICHKSYRYFDRFFYVTKINKIYKGFLQELGTKLNGKCLFHAHSLFINGAVAFKLKKKTNINYVVAVRSTDVKVFFKYLFFLRSFGINILMDASKIIFISHVYRDLVLKNYVSDKDRKIILDKCVVIPNGIDGFWHENSLDIKEYSMKSPIKVLYVGQFIKRKNSLKLIKSITALKDDGIDISLMIVGDGQGIYNKIIKMNSKYKSYIEVIPWVSSKNELLKLYRSADIFALPSDNETFGLVYIEAISQGLPILYVINEGIDGYFKNEEVGVKIKTNVDDITLGIRQILENYKDLKPINKENLSRFRWYDISKNYMDIYLCN
jgi:glycosyltransferase involved in cell wall biosynthesis